MYRNPIVAPYKPSISRSPGGESETFLIAGAVGLDRQSIYGAITEGYVNGQDRILLEFKIGEEKYGWVFDRYVSGSTIDFILSGLKHDPDYREQFRKPAVPAKGVDSVHLGAHLSKAFGEHEIVSQGDAEPTPHSWEQITKILVREKLPAYFATFARKCSFLKLSRVKGNDFIAVRAPLGGAYKANLMLLTILEDFNAGKLGDQKAYGIDFERQNLMPTKPTIITSIRPSEKAVDEPSVSEKIEYINKRMEPYKLENQLRFLKAGRDEYSAMKEAEIKSKIKPEDQKIIVKRFPLRAEHLMCMRWHLRGLSVPDAILKVNPDIEKAKIFAERAKGMQEFDR